MALPLVGEEVAGYWLRAVLGRGGMSVVYQAENSRLGSAVALKVMTPELATDDVFRARFLQESRIAASLNHPNVIPIYDVGLHGELLYLAMRFVDGADLRAVLKEQGRISPAQAVPLITQAARALDAAHRRGLVHRDVKPANILIERAGEEGDPDHVYLADFGITKHALSRSGLTATGQFLGTIDYVAPEQIKGEPVDARADVYSLACVLYECITGRVPFMKDMDAAVIWAHVEEPPPPPSSLRPDLPTALDSVLVRALAKDPAERYPTCRELAEAARTAVGGTAGIASMAAPEPATVLRGRPPGASTAPRDQYRYSVPPPTPAGTGGPHSGQAAAGAVAGAGAGTGAPPGWQQAAGTGPGSPGTPGQPGHAGPAGPGGPGGRQRRWPLLAAAAAAVLVVAAGAAYWGFGRSGAAPPPAKKAARGGAMHNPAHPMTNALLKALAETNKSTMAHGLVPPSSCHAQGTSMATCTNPSLGVQTVMFKTYPSRKALYTAYVAAIQALGDKPLRTNYGNCDQNRTDGEVGWNHDFQHPKNYSLDGMRMGMVNDNQAAGRLFCTFNDSGFHIVWLQNSGYVLGQLVGGPHESAYTWWVKVHHNIALPGSAPMHM